MPQPPASARARRNSKGLWIASASVIVAAAIACVLVFVVFHDGIFGDGDTASTDEGAAATTTGATTVTTIAGGTTLWTEVSSTAATPEEAVLLLFTAMENKDFDALFALFDPVALGNVLGDLSLDDAKKALAATMFDYGSIDFSGLEFSTEMTGDTTATVTVVAGTVTMVDFEGVTGTEDATAAGQPVTFAVVEREGAWYLDPTAMFGSTVQ